MYRFKPELLTFHQRLLITRTINLPGSSSEDDCVCACACSLEEKENAGNRTTGELTASANPSVRFGMKSVGVLGTVESSVSS